MTETLAPPAPPTPTPQRRWPKWPFVLLGLLVAIGLAVVLLYPLRIDYIAFAPGSLEDVDGFIAVEDDIFEYDGELYFLTVTTSDVNIFEYIEAFFDPQVDLTERQRVRPNDVTREEQNRRNLASMRESQRAATYVALTRLGMEPEGNGALVTDLVDDSPAIGVLDIDDIIVGINGTPVTLAEEVIDIVSPLGPGEVVMLEVRRGENGPVETVELTLAEHPDDPERGLIGIFLTTSIEFPVEVQINSGSIGGPSAGLMWTLGLINLLSEEDITKGHRIAGTGTIRFDGSVGPIGGMRQKVFAAIDGGAEYVLVPIENAEDALDAAGDDIEIVPVATIDEALAFLDALEPVERFAAEG